MSVKEEIAIRAEQLWREAGEPKGRALEFWVKAEKEAAAGDICILSPGQCKHQSVEPTTGGRHVAHCTKPGGCRNRASNYVG